jgi:hypothetical protein
MNDKTLCIFTLAAGFAAIGPAASFTPLTFPVAGTANTGSFIGNFHLTGFHYGSRQVFMDGIVSGTVNQGSTATSVVQTVSQPLTIPQSSASSTATPAAASCPIINVNLGPINPNLQKLMVTTNKIVLNITDCVRVA